MLDPKAPSPATSTIPGAQSPDTIDLLLSLLPALNGLMRREEFDFYVEGCEQIDLPADTTLYVEGDSVDRILLIVAGQVVESRTQPVNGTPQRARVRDAFKGVLLGIYDQVHRRPHTTVAQTASQCQLISIPAAQISRLLYRFPQLRNAFLPTALTNRLRSIPLLAGVDLVTLTYMADVLRPRPALAGETIYQAGDEAALVYLIDHGQVRLENVAGSLLWLGTGAEFGFGDATDLPVDQTYLLDHNAVAVCAASLLVLSRRQFHALTGGRVEQAGWVLRNMRHRTVQELGLFAQWQPQERAHLLGFMSHYHMPAGYLVMQQGEPADSLWILLPESRALIHALDAAGEAQPETKVTGVGYFNETALRAQGVAASTIEAEPMSGWLRLHWKDFGAFLDQTGRKELGSRLRVAHQPPSVKETRRRRRFTWLDVGETVVLEVRRHWIDLVLKSVPALLLTLVVLFAWGGMAGAAAGREGAASNLAQAEAAATAQPPPAQTPVATPDPATASAPTAVPGSTASPMSTAAPLPTAVPTPTALESSQRQLDRAESGVRLARWFFALALFLALLAWLWGILDYLNDYLVVTNQRVVHQDKLIFFKNRRYLAPLESVRDIKIDNGFWGAQLGFANVELQTPGSSDNIRFTRVAHYKLVDQRIRAERARRSQQYRATGKKQIHATLENRLGVALELPARVWPNSAQATPLDPAGKQARRKHLAVAVSSAGATEAGQRIVWRQHWLILLRNIFFQAMLLLLVFAGAIYLVVFRSTWEWTNNLLSVALVAGTSVLLWSLWVLEDWRIDMYILDRDQVIDIERRPLALKNTQRTAQLTDLVDIKFEQRSPLHMLFNFGSVYLQTAGSDGQFTFLNVPDPQMVVETITRRRDQAQQAIERKKALQRAEEFPDWLEIYTRLQPGRGE